MLAEDRPVLLIDDDADDRFLVEEAWRQAGIANPLVAVEDGLAALDRLRRLAPAFVLLDIKMPGLSGFQVLERLRQDAATALLPVIILTASTAPRDVESAYRAGANAFFVKPSSVEELIELLASLKACWLRFNEFPPPAAPAGPTD